MSLDGIRETILELTQDLLVAITSGDWNAYTELCDPSLTAFEPEALGYLIEGLDFHRFYFQLGAADESDTPVQSTIVAPHIRVLGDVAIIAYTRLTQKVAANGHPISVAMEETRVWHRQGDSWRHVHFHRSKPTN